MAYTYLPALRAALLTAALGLLTFAGHGQAPARTWLDAHQSGPGVKATATWTDPAGATYLVGRVTNPMALPGLPPLGANPDAAFFACLDSANAWRWVRTVMADSGTVTFTAVAGDTRGGTYVTGSFSGTVTLGPGVRLRAATIAPAAFVARYDSAGTPRWARSLTTTSGVDNPLLVVDPSGRATVAFLLETSGPFGAALTLGPFQVQAIGRSDAVVARISPQGTWLWVAQSTGTADEFATDLDVDAQGDVLVTGGVTSFRQWVNTDSIAQFGAIRFTVPAEVFGGSIPLPPSVTFFMAKLSAQGQWQWATNSQGRGAYSGAATVSPAGEVYLMTDGDSATVFGPLRLPPTAYGPVLGKLSATGQWQWLRAISSGGIVALTPAGHPCVVGTFGDALYLDSTRLVLDSLPRNMPTAYHISVVQLDPAGQLEWVLTARGSGESRWQSPLVGAGMDARGRLTVVGAVFDSLTLGPVVLTNPARGAGGASVFVARIGPAGTTGLPAAVASSSETSLYPNPVRRGQPLTLDLSAAWTGARVEVLNALGQVVGTGTARAGRTSVPTAGLPAGLYSVRVLSTGRHLTRRVVVE